MSTVNFNLHPEGSKSEPDYPRDKTIVDLLNEQTQRTPHNIAVVFEEERLTYRELDERSNQLAHYLRARGVQEETLVPICLNRSLEMIIGIVAILKAGGVYVPIDPEYPEDRIQYQLADTRAALAITDAPSRHLLINRDGLKTVVCLHTDRAAIEQQPVTPVTTSITPRSLAYIIYTSGSTGRPKGVMIEHYNVVRLFFTDAPLYDFDEKDVWTMFHSFCFDFSVWEMYGALFYGGKLIVVPKSVAKDTAAFGELLIREQVTVLNQTPSAFYVLQEYIVARQASEFFIRYVIYGGEALTPRKIKPWKELYKDCRLINMYGITETTVHVTFQEIGWEHLDSALSIIGVPIPTLTLYILDENRQETPVDVQGELYVGGAGLARGYLNLPQLTAERFIPNPFSREPGARLYKTGDLAQRLADGNIEYLGRIDDQVKIRGFRIELGEIENVILQHPGVKNAVVLAREGKGGDKRLVAYIVSEGELDRQSLTTLMESKLPEYMVPRLIMRIDMIPLTSNGKTDKKALPDPDASELLTTEFVVAGNATEEKLVQLWQELLNVKKVGVNDNFFELGGNSLLAVKTTTLLQQRFGIELPVTKVYQYPTVGGIAAWLDGKKKDIPVLTRKNKVRSGHADIAVIAMAGRFPGANTIDELWDMLKEGRETITHFSKEELDPSLPAELVNDPDYVAARGIIDDATRFDAAFFGINPKLAAPMDPQQRVFLELAWEALEKAGCLPGKYNGSVGVFAGTGHNTYFLNNVFNNKTVNDTIGSFQAMLVNDKDFIATRTAYELNLKGPAVSMHTACSTSLLAIATAVESLRKGQCDIALAGAASITAPIRSGHLYQDGAMLSKDGHNRSFDADAQGTMFSDGAGVVLLKTREDAERDGDTIYALIKGVGVNNDGGDKSSFTAPSAEGQAGAIAMAIDDAGIPASSISYVEGHGTATPLGDPIEVEGLRMAFGPQEHRQFCALGTIKSNMGHLTAASGVAGLIKTVLALYHQQIPASINYERPNPNIDFTNSPFYVNTMLRKWETTSTRRAGVSSFGVGGTNVHIVLEESGYQPKATTPGRPVQLFTWSAKTAGSLEGYANKLAGRVMAADLEPADIAYTLQHTRRDMAQRRFVLGGSREELAARLSEPSAPLTEADLTGKDLAEVVFMFPGQGSQHINMGRELYELEPVFRKAVDECAALLLADLQEDIRDILYPAVVTAETEAKINNTFYAQPALFVIEYALARLWMSWGIQPAAFIGHSIGEFVAAHLAGVFSLQDGLHLIATRGRLMAELPGGSMLGVRADHVIVAELLPAGLSLAAINSPALCVVAGPDETAADFSRQLEEKGISNRLLYTSHAFHSAMMDPIIDPFAEVVRALKLSIPRIPIVSTVTGQWMTDTEATDPGYWAGHLRSTVRFSTALVTLLEESNRLMLEAGPRNVTTTLARQHGFKRPVTAISSLDDSGGLSESRAILKALGQLWINGIQPDWAAFYGREQRRIVDIPTYSFDRKRYWIDPMAQTVQAGQAGSLPAGVAQAGSFANPITIPAAAALATPASDIPFTQPVGITPQQSTIMRKTVLIERVKGILENASGIEMEDVRPDMNFIEIGLDSLLLTQVAISLKKEFGLPITFRQLNDEYGTLDQLAAFLDANLPQEATPAPAAVQAAPAPVYQTAAQPVYQAAPAFAAPNPVAQNWPLMNNVDVSGMSAGNTAIGLIAQQMHLLAQQIALLQGAAMGAPAVMPAAPAGNGFAQPGTVQPAAAAAQPAAGMNGTAVNGAQHVNKSNGTPTPALQKATAADLGVSNEELVELKKPFGATARIEKHATAMTPEQHAWLNNLIKTYTARTKGSKDYTQQHRARMADPRVVSGFKPYTKEIVYSVVINKSKGSRLWDIDGNEYIDMLNGFGSNMLGYQPDFVAEAVKQQVDKGYEIGPQHELAGEVTDLICEFTGFDRVGLCNTGSEAVLGAMRIARTVTGRSLIVAFTGSYHGIVDEVIVRGTKKLKSFPAASGIMPEAVQNMLILDYGTDESLRIIRERAHELAAVLVEPVQSRRPEFVPIEFLKELRKVTEEAGTALIFDEVITGFRTHPRGFQGMYGIRGDLGTYGKVIGAGLSIGVIAGKRAFMDALDGGFWQYGDNSTPEIGVTYFAGTFVRHPLALASAKASLTYMKQQGPGLQERLNASTTYLANSLEAICRKYNTPMFVAQFCSVWKIKYKEEYPYSELLFTVLRNKGVHILDGFPCFLTTSHTREDIDTVIRKFEEAVSELKQVGLIPDYPSGSSASVSAAAGAVTANAGAANNIPPVPNARLGKDRDGNPAWFVPDEKNPGKYLQVQPGASHILKQ